MLMINNINTAPKDGTTIIGVWDDGEEFLMFWSERPVCMLGSRNGGHPPGWATAGDNVDSNLPVDEPPFWRRE